jgi:hypothetical protein
MPKQMVTIEVSRQGVTPEMVDLDYMILMHLKIENLDRKLMSTR